MTKLSVVIPTYNRAATLDRCLEHLARQTLDRDRFEVIVADDASDDHTPDVGLAWERSGRLRLRYRRCEKGFAAGARNRGTEWATAPRIVFLGDDILAAPDLLERHLDAAEQAGPDLVTVGSVRFDQSEPLTPFMRFMEAEGVHHDFPTLERQRDHDLDGWYFYACNASVPTAAVRAVGGFDEHLRRAWEDSEMGFRLVRSGCRLRYLPEASATHVHPMTLDRYLSFLRSGRQDAIAAIRAIHEAGEPLPPLAPHPWVDRIVNDRFVMAGAHAVARVDRYLPEPLRRAVYWNFVRLERRRAFQGAM